MTRTNRLAQEKSPYLLQHARNPVDWHPWGQEAIDKARREDKPLFLSIGYSTCHWCHVMERESFEDVQIAEKLNRNFVPVKVDREERPDVDKIYMTAVQAMTGQGGWPLSAFLTPQLKPFFGGTYFPPQPRFGMPGFGALLDRIAELWKTQREAIETNAGKLTQALSQFSAVKGAAQAPQAEWIAKAARGYLASFDPANAGFGGAPKFPMPVNQGFLLRAWAMTGEEEPRKAAAATLRAMARGGIRDHLGGGFHRYSTDECWRVPHFEKMLYDNAQLAVNYLEMCQAEWDEEFAASARAALDYLLRDLRGPEGEIYSAEDADSLAHGEKKEGAFYLWTEAELKAELADDAPIFLFTYGILPEGNSIHDPHGELAGQNVLYEAHTLPEVCEQFGLSAEEAASRLAKAHRRLLGARAKRPRPSRDDKVLACWNGLAISAFAKGWQVLEDPRYLEAARQAASFIKDRLWDRGERKLWRRWCDGERAVPGTADDYAFMIQGLLDLFEADFDPAWLDWALDLSRRLRGSFEDAGGGYYLTAQGEDPNLLLRVMDDTDNVEPCASSAAALSFLRLSELTGDQSFREAAAQTLARFGSQMRNRPQAMPAMLSAAIFALSSPQQVVLAGDLSSAEGKRMLSEVRTRFAPARTVAAVGQDGERLGKIMPWLKDMKPQGGKPTAYVCLHFACQRPVTDAAALAAQLEA